jgi:hypothetical protein
MGGERTWLRYKRSMAPWIFRLAVAGLAFLTASAPAEPAGGERAEETITLSRSPMGLHALDAPDYDVTLSPNGQVVVLRRSYDVLSPGKVEMSQRVETYRVSPIEAARFRAALMPHEPVGHSPNLICGGHEYGPDNPTLVRVPVFHIEWKGAGSGRALDVCITAQEKGIVDEIQQGLRALHLTLEGSRT